MGEVIALGKTWLTTIICIGGLRFAHTAVSTCCFLFKVEKHLLNVKLFFLNLTLYSLEHPEVRELHKEKKKKGCIVLTSSVGEFNYICSVVKLQDKLQCVLLIVIARQLFRGVYDLKKANQCQQYQLSACFLKNTYVHY